MYWMSSHSQPALDGPLATGLGEGPMTTVCKIQHVTQCYNKPQTGKNSSEQHKKWGFIFCTKYWVIQ